MDVMVWFWPNEMGDRLNDEPLMRIRLPVVPRVGEFVVLPVKHEEFTRSYRVTMVSYQIEPENLSVDVHLEP